MPAQQTSDEIITGGPSDQGSSTDKTPPNPIGVPYAAWDPQSGQYVPWGVNAKVERQSQYAPQGGHGPESGRVTSTTQFQMPRYYGGDELQPAGWDPNKIRDLQQRLVAAGLIPKGASFVDGFWDITSQKAYEELLGYANQTGMEWTDALDQYTAAPKAGDSGRAPLTVRTSNPDDLKAVFRKAWMDTTGYGIDQEKVDAMVASYQGIEAGAQQQAYGMEETGGTVTAPPDPSVFAEKQATEADPLGVQENSVIKQGGMLDAFKGMLDGWLV